MQTEEANIKLNFRRSNQEEDKTFRTSLQTALWGFYLSILYTIRIILQPLQMMQLEFRQQERVEL